MQSLVKWRRLDGSHQSLDCALMIRLSVAEQYIKSTQLAADACERLKFMQVSKG